MRHKKFVSSPLYSNLFVSNKMAFFGHKLKATLNNKFEIIC